jgi:hypothetical protein
VIRLVISLLQIYVQLIYVALVIIVMEQVLKERVQQVHGVLLGERQAHRVLKRSVAQDIIVMVQVLELLVALVRG